MLHHRNRLGLDLDCVKLFNLNNFNSLIQGEMVGGVGVLEPPESLLQAFISRSEDKRTTHISDLPTVLLSSVLSRISDPVDITSLVCSCRLFRAISKSVPYHLRVSSSKADEGAGVAACEESTHNRYSLPAVGSWTRKLLTTVRSQMPATKVLDLSGCWIVDEDVAAVLADLRCLECLILDGCQKLTSAVADALAVSVRSGPQALSLQRCFGLGPAAAGNLLAAAAADGSRLQCILLSHLDRLELPRDPPLLEAQEFKIDEDADGETSLAKSIDGGVSAGSGIRVLALHNCGSLGSPELAAVGMTCPMLEFLLLGGSVEGLCLNRFESLPQENVTAAVSALVRTVESLTHLLVLEITFFSESVAEGVREHIGKGIEVWDFCERKSVSSALTFLDSCKLFGCTDFVHECSTNDLANDSTAERDAAVLSGQKKLYGAKMRLDMHSRNDVYICSYEGTEVKDIYPILNGMAKKKEWVENILLAVRGAVNCSDMRRRTPLHIAANGGDTEIVRGLLAMGAVATGLRDSSGATALFSAAWFGHADICELLLKSGADVLSRNRACENPLYIAALRGHPAAVEVMLSHCTANNINWQCADVYGDGWTPLMAAAVADRQDVAKVLLRAAGSDVILDCTRDECRIWRKGSGELEKSDAAISNFEGNEGMVLNGQEYLKKVCTKDGIKTSLGCTAFSENSLMKTPPQILDAQNRYGQTALHIAARRASVWIVVNLLHAGASVDIRDEYGKRAVDIALGQNHAVVTNMLRQWELWLTEMTTSCVPRTTNAGLPCVLSPPKCTSGNPELRSKQSCQDSSVLSQRKTSRNRGAGASGVRSLPIALTGETSEESVISGNPKRVWRVKVKGNEAHSDKNTTAFN